LKKHIAIPSLFIVLIFVSACSNDSANTPVKDSSTHIVPPAKRVISSDSVITTDTSFIADSLLHIDKRLIAYLIKKYSIITCPPPLYAKEDLREDSNNVTRIGYIIGGAKADSVFVLSPLSAWDDGQSYYFTDTSLPRLVTDSWCCHPENIFLVGDIDEDGVQEIGWYYSTCASHYKSLYVVTLKNNRWDTVGHSVFDQHYMSCKVPFSNYVRKTGKGKFEMLEITDLTENKAKAGKKNWLQFSMK
jgi:hypothetical protein